MGFQGVNDCRQGESSGYESVIRDSECSSFGSSQDSGLDDDGNSLGPKKGKYYLLVFITLSLLCLHSGGVLH